jgi:hypothetical protein
MIEKETGPAQHQKIAFDPEGNTIAVWYQYDVKTFNIWANRYDTDKGWGQAELIETGSGNAYDPNIALDTHGNAFAVWQQHDGTSYRVWANRYDRSAGWGKAELIETGSGNVNYPEIALDSEGNALSVWRQRNGKTNNIWANRYDRSAGWSKAALIETNSGNADCPKVALGPDGNGVAVWQQHDGADSSIWINRYDGDKGWRGAELIEKEAGNAINPNVAVDKDGNAIVIWQQHDGATYRIRALWIE